MGNVVVAGWYTPVRTSTRLKLAFGALAAASALCVVLLELRCDRQGEIQHGDHAESHPSGRGG